MSMPIASPPERPRFAALTDRIAGPGADAWDLHYEAVRQIESGEIAAERVLLLSVGEPDFATPAPITQAAVAALEAGETRYTEMRGTTALRRRIAARYAERLGFAVDPGQVTVLAGAQSALFGACLVLLEAGDEVIVPDPAYVTYAGTLGAAGAVPVPIATRSEQGFLPDPAAIAAAITRRTRAILINDPGNPTGAIYPEALWREIATIARAHNLWLVVDEVYRDLAFPDAPAPFSPACLPGMAGRTVMINSLSKSHAMTGWRLGWSVGPADFAEHAARLNVVMLYGAPEFVQSAACTALDLGPAPARAMAAEYAARADAVIAALAPCPVLRPIAPAGGMFVMVDIRPTGITAGAFAQTLFNREGIVVLPGDAFGAAGAGHIRLGLVQPADVLGHACARIAAVAETLAGTG